MIWKFRETQKFWAEIDANRGEVRNKGQDSLTIYGLDVPVIHNFLVIDFNQFRTNEVELLTARRYNALAQRCHMWGQGIGVLGIAFQWSSKGWWDSRYPENSV